MAPLLSSLLLACAETPQNNAVGPIKTAPQVAGSNTKTTLQLSPEDYLAKAQQAFTNNGDTNSRNQWILQAAEAFANQQQWQQSQGLVHSVLPLLDDSMQLTHAYVLLAEAGLQQPQPDIEQIASWQGKMGFMQGFDERIQAVSAQILTYQHRPFAAANAWLATNMSNEDKATRLWQLLSPLSASELETARLRENALQPWLQLALIVQRFGAQPNLLQPAVAEWQMRFSHHALAKNLPNEVAKAMQTPLIDTSNVAVLLPLSGPLASQGLAIKEGILAAYWKAQSTDSNSVSTLDFVDTYNQSTESLLSAVANDHVIIGPLLKDQLKAMSESLTNEKILLGLNRLDVPIESNATTESIPEAPKEQYFYALAPEDEAIQLAWRVQQQGYRHPVIFAANNPTTIRMAQTFSETWKTLIPESNIAAAELFTDSKSMRNRLKETLDLGQSEKRVNQVERYTAKKVYSVERNRRDIDAIILFASAEQTELFNPMIEASISPFIQQTMPVFASSRSYTQQITPNSLRDLRNLSFTDIPWMLPQSDASQLVEQTHQLWPERPDTLQRLFAMGYDAYRILPELRHMHLLPQLKFAGQTGQLSLDAEGQIQRRLPMGKITAEGVTLVALD